MGTPSPRRLRFALAGLLGLAGLLALAVLTAQEAEASHFRGGSIYHFTDTAAGPEGARMEGSLYFRLTYFTDNQPIQVGDYIDGSSLGSIGSYCAGWRGHVVTVNPLEDWFGVHVSDGVNDFVRCNWAPSGTHMAAFQGQARLNDGLDPAQQQSQSGPLDHHVNNPSTVYSLRSTFTNGNNAPFSPDFPPIWYCDENAVCWIPLEPVDPDGNAITARWSTSPEFGATYYPPGPCPGVIPTALIGGCGPVAPATILPNNTIRWDTTGATVYPGAPAQRTFYSAQVMLADGRGGLTPLEFLIAIGQPRTEPPTPPPSCSPATTSTTVGTPYTFAASSGVAPYTWSAPGGTPSSGAGSSFTTQYASAATYTVTVADANGDTAECEVRVDDPPVNCFPATQTVALRQSASFDANGGMSGAYAWDAPSGTPGAGSGIRFSTAYAAPGTYTVTVASGNRSAACTVEVPSPPPGPPTASFAWVSASVCDGWAAQFRDTSTGPAPIASWAWEFGDGATALGAGPTHAYAGPGTYTVRLTVTDANGMSGSAASALTFRQAPCASSRQDGAEAGHAAGTPRDGRDAALAGPDSDGDGLPDGEDACPRAPGPPGDLDGDGTGDACDPDRDGDAVPNAADLCPGLVDPMQADLDGDGEGDACDDDRDGDGAPDAEDACPDEPGPACSLLSAPSAAANVPAARSAPMKRGSDGVAMPVPATAQAGSAPALLGVAVGAMLLVLPIVLVAVRRRSE